MQDPWLEDEPEEAILTFREQQDGKRVAFLGGGKCVIVGRDWLGVVGHGERWRVRLWHRDTFAIAQPTERIFDDEPVEEDPAPGAPAIAPAAQAASVPVRVVPEPSRRRPPAPHEGPTKIQGMIMEPDNVIRPKERVAFFIDAANIDFATRELGFFLDWQQTLDYFLADGHFSDAYYYVAEYGDDGPQREFLDRLTRLGFIVRTKPVKVIVAEDGARQYKGNLDIEVALDMVAAAEHYDVAYLFSGDSDFKRVVEVLQSRGKRVYVVSSRGSLSRELGYIASKPLYLLDDFGKVLKRDGSERTP